MSENLEHIKQRLLLNWMRAHNGVRYTGSEIYHSAHRCAREAIRIAKMLSVKSLCEWRGRHG